MFGFQNVRTLSLAAVAGIGLALLPVWALAEPIDRVEVQGKALRTDVKATCPSIGESLGERLGSQFGRDLQEGDYRVEFSLQGDQVSEVSAQGGEWSSNRAIRRAMRGVDCQDAKSQAPHRFAFMLSVRIDDDAGGAPVARFDVKPATLFAAAR